MCNYNREDKATDALIVASLFTPELTEEVTDADVQAFWNNSIELTSEEEEWLNHLDIELNKAVDIEPDLDNSFYNEIKEYEDAMMAMNRNNKNDSFDDDIEEQMKQKREEVRKKRKRDTENEDD